MAILDAVALLIFKIDLIASDAGSGPSVQLMLGNGDGTFQPPPVITSLSPSATAPGSASFTLTITGTGFQPGATVSINNGVTVSNVNVIDANGLFFMVTVSNSAALGPRTVTVTNPDGGVGSSSTVFSVGFPSA